MTLISVVCVFGKADIIFVLDGSGSVGQGNFTVMKEFVKNVTKSLYIKPQYIRIGIKIFIFTVTGQLNYSVLNSKK